MRPVDITMLAFADELASLEKTASVKSHMGAAAFGLLGLPLMGQFAAGQAKQYLRGGQQDYGDFSRPQFERRFGQHLPGASSGEVALMTAGNIKNWAGHKARSVASGASDIAQAARPAINTAVDTWRNQGPGYIRSNWNA